MFSRKNEKTSKTPIEVEKSKLNIFDKSIYNNLFPIQIRDRGERYCYDNRLGKLKRKKNKYYCIVKGTNNYNVELLFNTDENIATATCSCPYYNEEKKYCKHIYAVLYKIKCSKNKKKILSDITKKVKRIELAIISVNNYIKRNLSNFTDYEIDKFNNYVKEYICEMDYIKANCSEKQLEDDLLNQLKKILNISFELSTKIKKTLNSANNSKNNINSYLTKQDEDNIDIIMSDFDITSKSTKHLHKNIFRDAYNRKIEKEMNTYNLEDWQKDLVRNGLYNPWNFDEENLEEDDFYYEDDK